jgi:oligopeptidase B
MRPLRVWRGLLLTIALAPGGCAGPGMNAPPSETRGALPAPPVALREPQEVVLHGHRRVDDYAWLRRKDAPEVLAYLRAENAYTEAMMRPTLPLQETLYREMLGRIKQTDLSVPVRRRGWLYYSRTEEGKQYPIRCRKKGKESAPEQVLLDLNEIASTEKFVGLGTLEVSLDGRRLAYTLDTSGFRVYTLYVKDLRTGKVLADRASAVGSVQWADDGRTLFYVTEDAQTKRPHKLWRHTLGNDASKDELIYEETDARFELDVSRTRSDRFLLVSSQSHTTSEVRYLAAGDPRGELRVIAPRLQDQEYEVDHRDDLFYILTNDQGRNFRLVTAPTKTPDREHWRELTPHREDVMLGGVDVFRDFYVLYQRNEGLPTLQIVSFRDGKSRSIATGEPVYALWPGTNLEFATSTYRYHRSSFLTPESVFEEDVRTGRRTLLKRTEVQGGYDPSRYQQERRFATAADGTLVPISILSPRGAPRDGRAPLLLTAYGAYGRSSDPTFDSNRFSLVDRGVTVAIAHVRGGGELGKRWHDGGRMMNKMNTFTDFISCAEQLVADRYTAPDRLAISGGSAGGLLVGAVLNLSPALFKAAVASVPFVDVLSTMLDETLPLTVGEFEEWGNPREQAQYEYMAAYSPYDNVTARAYPSLLVKSAYNDSQVMYFEPAKWVAKLRALKTDRNPLLMKMDLDPAGHGGKSGRYERLREAAFVMAFVLTQIGAVEPEGAVTAGVTASRPGDRSPATPGPPPWPVP